MPVWSGPMATTVLALELRSSTADFSEGGSQRRQRVSRVVYSESLIAGMDASDAYGHGTHVAGIIGSNAASSSGAGFSRKFKGIAPNVNLINLRALDQNGSGLESDVIAAVQRAIDL